MAEQGSDQEKSQPATPKKLQDAKDKGDVPRSRELSTSLLLFGGVIALFLSGEQLTKTLADIFVNSFSITRANIFNEYFLASSFMSSNIEALKALLPLLAALACLAVAGPLAIGGWAFSVEAIGAKWNRLSPISGLKRVFGPRGLVEMLKALAKFFLILGFALAAIATEFDQIRVLGLGPLLPDLMRSTEVVFRVFAITTLATLFITLIDVPFQLWEYQRKHRMSFQEIKDELKQQEGTPETRSRISRLQQELANRRMMEEVPKANVIVTNPTHYSVALKFDPETMSAPIVVAKGVDLVAFRIREIATEHKIAVISAPPLARTLYYNTKLGGEIPSALYLAVAKVLAYVFGIDSKAKARPLQAFDDLPIPPEYKV